MVRQSAGQNRAGARSRQPSDPSDLTETPGGAVPGSQRPDSAAGTVREPSEDTELDEPLPDAERLLAVAVALAGDDVESARLVRRYWRFAPDEELVGLTPERMLADAREHR